MSGRTHWLGPILLWVALAGPAAAQSTTGGRAFAVEALGGTVGSAAGVGLGARAFRPGSCDGEDVACILQRLGLETGAGGDGTTEQDDCRGNE